MCVNVCSILTLSNSLQESEEGADHGGHFVCPLCTLDFSSPEKLISHVYQVRARDLNGIIFNSLFLASLLSADTLFCPAAHGHDEQQQELRVPGVWAGPQLPGLAGTTSPHPL